MAFSLTSKHWNTPEIIGLVNNCPHNPSIDNWYKKAGIPRAVVLDLGWTGRQSGGNEYIKLFVKDINITLASAYFKDFTGNCGMRALVSPSICFKNSFASRLWMETVDAYAHRLELSAIVASDGPYQTDNLIRHYGKGWIEVSKREWINRRMGAEHKMNVWIRYLNDPEPNHTLLTQ